MTTGNFAGGPGFNLDMREILGDSLPPKSYIVNIVLHTVSDTVVFDVGERFLYADTLPATRDLSDLSFSTTSGLEDEAPRKFVVRVAAMTHGTRRVHIEYGACALRLRAYRTSVRTGQPVWRSEYASDFRYRIPRVCPAYLALADVIPGQEHSPREFQASHPVLEILGDSLPAGRYYFTAELTLLNTTADRSSSKTFLLDAGVADLSGIPEKLPSVRLIGPLRYEAFSGFATAAKDTIRVAVRLTNVGASAVRTSVPRDCPVIAYGYRSAARRDAVPALEPDYVAGGCQLYIHEFVLEPGESWVFWKPLSTVEVRRALGSNAYFTAWIATGPGVILAAGKLTL